MGFPDLSGYSDHQLVAAIIIAWLTAMGGLIHLAIKQHATAKDAKAAKDQTVGTGNGFAKSVKDSLTEIKESISSLETKLRADNVRLEHRLDEHMNNHDRRSK